LSKQQGARRQKPPPQEPSRIAGHAGGTHFGGTPERQGCGAPKPPRRLRGVLLLSNFSCTSKKSWKVPYFATCPTGQVSSLQAGLRGPHPICPATTRASPRIRAA
jgi:hypothetical protein